MASRATKEPESNFWATWVAFAAVMLILVAIFNVMEAAAAIFSDEYFSVNEDGLLTFNYDVWGALMLAMAALHLAAGAGLMLMRDWGRWLALLAAILNATTQAGFIAALPAWALIQITFDVLVIFALTVKWGQVERTMYRG